MLSECYDVTFKAPMLSLARQCYLHPTVLPHNPIYSPTFLVTLLPGYHVTMLPCYHVTMLPCYHVTMLPCYMLPSILSSYFSLYSAESLQHQMFRLYLSPSQQIYKSQFYNYCVNAKFE